MSPTSSATWLKPTTSGLLDLAMVLLLISLNQVGRAIASCNPNKNGPAIAGPLVAASGAVSAQRRLHHDLDLERGVGELGLDGGAGRRVAGRHPGVPHLVHLAPGADVGQPDVGREDLRLVGAGFL